MLKLALMAAALALIVSFSPAAALKGCATETMAGCVAQPFGAASGATGTMSGGVAQPLRAASGTQQVAPTTASLQSQLQTRFEELQASSPK